MDYIENSLKCIEKVYKMKIFLFKKGYALIYF